MKLEAWHPENFCEKCGQQNIVWFIENNLWNRYSDKHDIICPICFVKQAESKGFIPTSWELKPEVIGDTPKVIVESEVKGGRVGAGVMLPKAVYKLVTAIKFGWWAYKHNDIFNENYFKMLSEILGLILAVGAEDRHYMTQIIVTNPQTNVVQPIVHIWAGAGISAEPLKRIQELIEENEALKDRLRSK